MKTLFHLESGYFAGYGTPFSLWFDHAVEKWEGAEGPWMDEKGSHTAGHCDALLKMMPRYRDEDIYFEGSIDHIPVKIFSTLESRCRIGFNGDGDQIFIYEDYAITDEDQKNWDEADSVSIDTGSSIEKSTIQLTEASRMYAFPAERSYKEVQDHCVLLPLKEKQHGKPGQLLGPGFKTDMKPGKWVIRSIAGKSDHCDFRGLLICREAAGQKE